MDTDVFAQTLDIEGSASFSYGEILSVVVFDEVSPRGRAYHSQFSPLEGLQNFVYWQ